MTIAAGTRLGPYEVGKLLGAGGMGAVYEATDTRLRRVVAVKVLHEQDLERERDLEREARAVAALSHPNICVLHDVGRHEGRAFLVMERLSGETLATRLERGPLAVNEALRYALDISGALDAAHRSGILHRDIKPSNIMLTKSGPKLLDFGLAVRDRAGSMLETLSAVQPNVFAGTLAYMSPERLEGKPADVRSDIFALGAVLHEMLSGRPPFGGATAAAVIAAILAGEPAPLEGVPAGVARVVRRCLAKDPEERWQSVRDFREALSLSRPDTPDVAGGPTVRHRRWLLPLVALLIAAGAVASFAPWFHSPAAGGAGQSSAPVIMLMDSPVPERVYDPATRREGGTNADDITDVLRDLPVQLHKETTSALWHREDEVLKQHPSLIMMHLSSFAEPTTDATSPLQPNAQERTRAFLGYIGLAEPRTKFIVYSRGFGSAEERARWVEETERRFPGLTGRVQLMHIPGGDGKATFRDPATQKAVRDAVTLVLNLRLPLSR